MNSTSFLSLVTIDKQSTIINIPSWFIPIDIFMIVCAVLTMLFTLIFLSIIIVDKKCHTVPMMLVANSCLIGFILSLDIFGMTLFTIHNDLKQIQYQDSFCVFRGYLTYVGCAILYYSFLLQAIYRYVTAVYPHCLFWQSVRFQMLVICLTWIFGIAYSMHFLFTGQIVYNPDNQICQMILQLSISVIYMTLCFYILPLLMTMVMYFNIVRHVQAMSKRVIVANTLFRVQRDLKILRRIVILTMILFTSGFPYALFMFMSFFNHIPKYHFRIAYLFINLSSVLVMIALFQFTESLKAFIMKRINAWSAIVVPTVA